MELRVWVDGTQRVVCGVKLTTTCQEIVFALAQATQQAGRFTMIERWRNNERLLSPNEQPLVTLQRWGDHMNEVEFILRKTSTEIPSHSQMQQQQLQLPQPPQQRNNQPPAVPAKPRVTGPIMPLTNLNIPAQQPLQSIMPLTNLNIPAQQPLQSVNNAQMNYYHHQHQHQQNGSPLSLYQNNLRPRHPPCYLDYIEAMANRNSIMGHDMLRVIEEQKKVLIQSKKELNKLDNGQEYWEAKQNIEQSELVNRIEKEIHQLEELWKENQTQIQKLENQNFDKELQELKLEQVKMEQELEKQKSKLSRIEIDINLCKKKIEELQADSESESDSEDA